MNGLATTPRREIDAHRLLVRDLTARLPDAALVASHAQPWASVTFTGAQHVVALDLDDPAAARAFARTITDADFGLRGHLVAEIVASSDMNGRLLVEVLTVEDL